MLNEINEALVNMQSDNPDFFGTITMYGQVTESSTPELWNYFQFNRSHTSPSGTSTMDFTEYFDVSLVHEDHIPEDAVYEVIKKLNDVKGLKLAKQDIEYNYVAKKSSDTVVEIATITFSHVVKGYSKL